jgi:hypothetical protein
MYSGTTVGKRSGNIVGVHQHIDRVARRHLTKLLPRRPLFPSTKDILHFEGDNGPDGIKRKSPSVDEPWHYIDPKKPMDRALIDMMVDHQHNLAKALKTHDTQRAAFEAAWLAHAIVDGLTPAHHYPLADKIEELFGKPHHERLTVREKNIIKGNSRRDTVSKNWEYWGGRGIFATHFMFEFGVAAIILGKQYGKIVISDEQLTRLKKEGFEPIFRDAMKQVIELNTYEQFQRRGWDWRLARTVRLKLVPVIIETVILGWYAAAVETKKR